MRLFSSFFARNKATDKSLEEAIKNIFGYYPGNVAVYKLAFRHKSLPGPANNGFRYNNERLEYLGDAVLGSVVADFLFKKFPFKDEGFLTEMRSRIVSRSNLNMLSLKLGLDKLIQTGKENHIRGSSVLGDAFEAFVGALYLDKGYRFTQKVIVTQIIQCHLDVDELMSKEINFKSKMIEWAQKEKKTLEFVLTDEIENGKNNKIYQVNLMLEDKLVGEGKDFSIKKAEQNAARQAWVSLNETGSET